MRRLFFFLCSFFYIYIFASIVSADGMVVPRPGLTVTETDQRAVIWHDGKTETLIVSITFEGKVDDFAWIIPVPSKPEVEAGVDELFTGLEKLTAPKYEPPAGGFGMYGNVNLSVPSKSAVTVVETKRVDIYDISVLTAESSSALQAWLEKKWI